MNTDSRKQKRDLISGILKVALAVSFVFLLILLLIGESISNTSFIISNRILFIIAVLVVTGICALRVPVKGKWSGFIVKHENLCVIMASAILLMVQLVIVYETIFQTSWDVAAVWYGSHWAALFVVGVVAYHVKPFTVIVLIAVMLIELIRCFIKLLDKSCQKRVKSWVIYGIIMVLSVLLCSGIISGVNHSLGFRIDRERELGIPHYLMMGVNRDTWGGYSYDDMEFGKEEKKEERNREELKEFSRRIHEMGLSGYGELFVHKASKSFLDGTFGWGTNESFYTEIYPVRGNSLCEILRSWYYGFESLYPYNAVIRQLLWIIILILVPFAAYKKSILRDDEKVLFLAVLGFMLYLQIFESHARYVFVFAPLFMILAFIGGKTLREIIQIWVFQKN